MNDDRYKRQSFLGEKAQAIIERRRIGIAGLGGGGSHIVQQLAHIGFLNYVIFDADSVELSNLNRLVGATLEDADKKRPKIEVASRVIRGLHPTASIEAIPLRWQGAPAALRSCDLVFGCVDSFSGRQELEVALRRFLIPYVDIGMDVHCLPDQPPRISGQVILSCPGHPCMRCLNFLNDDTLAREAQRYGDAGDHPQVVWTNGILASTAVGIAMDLITGWTQKPLSNISLVMDGNQLTMTRNHRLDFLPKGGCPHFPLADVGRPTFRPL